MGFLNRVIDPDVLRHRAPDGTRTQYLPISGDGVIDRENPADPESVDALDKKVDDINSATLDYSPSRLSSFCDDGCDKGCVDVPESVPDLSSDSALSDVRKAFSSITDTLANVQGTLTSYSGEMWVDRMSSIYSSAGFDIDAITEQTADVYDKLTAAASASEDAGNEALGANRVAVQSLRNSLADRAEHRINAIDMVMLVPMGLNPFGLVVAGGAAVGNIYSFWRSGEAREAGPEIIEAVQPALIAAAETNDQAVSELLTALEAWEVTVNSKAVTMPTTKAKDEAPEEDKKDDPDPSKDNKMPLVVPKTDTPGDTAAPTTVPASNNKSIRDQLGDLLDKYAQQTTPSAAQPAASPAMPDLGSMVPDVSSMIPDVSGLADAVEPMMDSAQDTEPMTERMGDEEPDDDDAADDEAAVEDDTAERTVDIGDRSVEFPNAELADMTQRMQENPDLSVMDAATAAGYELPPDGQPLGESIPPSQVMPGDIIATESGNGVCLGNGDVLMEGGEVQRLDDVAEFGDGQGIFRLAEPVAPVEEPTAPVLV